MRKALVAIITLCIIGTIPVFSIDISQKRNSQNIAESRNKILMAHVETGDPEKKMEALAFVTRMVADKSVDNMDQDFMAILDKLATETYFNPRKQGIGRTLVNDNPLVRLKTVKLLGEIGGPHAVNTLCTVLVYEDNSDILINTMYSLSKIGENPRMAVTDSIYVMTYRMRSMEHISNELAYATLAALEGIYDNGQSISDQKVYWVLVTLNDDRYYEVVRTKCTRVMDKTWNPQ